MVQEIKILRSNVSQREREKAERATLVTQERLVKSKVRRAQIGMRHVSAMPQCSGVYDTCPTCCIHRA